MFYFLNPPYTKYYNFKDRT